MEFTNCLISSKKNQNMAEEYSCPYCESIFESKDDLSKHIDRIHGDSGLLEGSRSS